MPVYNGADFVVESIQSILNQTFSNFEIIVVDDGSTDHTLEVLTSIEDERLQVLRNESNLGITQTRNRAMSHARGKYIAVLDSDDLAKPNRLEMQLEFLKTHGDYALVASWAEYIQKDGTRMPGMPLWMMHLPEECTPSMLLFQNFICHSSVMLRASMLSHPVYRNLEPSEDYDLWVRLAARYKMTVLPQSLVMYRIHNQNVSKTLGARQQETSMRIVLEQLQRFGVDPTEEELKLHHRMFWEASLPNLDILFDIREWLDKISRTNLRTEYYEQPAMERTIKYQWAKSCKRACGRNPLKMMQLLLSNCTKGNRWNLFRESASFVAHRIKAEMRRSL